MLPAAGILLTERLYIGIKINTLTDESYEEYARNNNGSIDIDIIDGRNQGFVIKCNGVTVNTKTGKNVYIEGFNGGIDSDWNAVAEITQQTYTLTVYDNAYKFLNTCTVTIGYNGTGSFITYNGVTYTNGQSFHFLNYH
jgi:hypothetical protein